VQEGVNTVTCSGVGGLAAIALGILKNPAVKFTENGGAPTPPLDDATLAALPKDPFTVSLAGNKYAIDIPGRTATVNDLKLKPFAIITGLHSKHHGLLHVLCTDWTSSAYNSCFLIFSTVIPLVQQCNANINHDRLPARRKF